MTTTMALMPQPDKLVVLTEVEHRLAAIKTVDEAKHIRDQAEAVRVYAKSAQLGLEIQNHAALVKIQAERKAGELLAQVARAQGNKDGKGLRATLARSAITPTTAKRWQRMAQVPDAVVRKYVADLDARSYEVTSAGVRRMWRELSGGSLRADVDGTVTWSPDERFHWLEERLVAFLQPGSAEWRHLESICTRLEQETLLGRLEALRGRVDVAIKYVRRQIDHEIDAADTVM